MPRVTIHVGGRERLNPTISKATLLLPTDALVWIGATCISGTATAMRALADALTKAAELADAYDADPDAFNQREHAERATDR
jgi:ribosomal protein S7